MMAEKEYTKIPPPIFALFLLTANAKGLEMSWLPLLETFKTFKGDIALENVKLIS